MNKKASIIDGIYITIICLALFLGFAGAKLVWDGVSDEGANFHGDVEGAVRVVNRYDNDIMPMMDNWFIFAILGSYISIFILAYFIRGSPAFIPIMIMVIIIGTVLSTFVSNAHDQLVSNPVISSAVADWTMTEYLMENLPTISFFYLIALSVIMLALGETI